MNFELIESKRMLFVKWVKTLIQNGYSFICFKRLLAYDMAIRTAEVEAELAKKVRCNSTKIAYEYLHRTCETTWWVLISNFNLLNRPMIQN